MVSAMVVSATSSPFYAQSGIVSDLSAKIRQEVAQNSHIMKTVHHLADVYGPRLTGSPNHRAAAEWAVRTMTSWGMVNGALEPWEFGHVGWTNEYLSIHAVSPFKDALVAEALAWTSGTPGIVKGTAFHLVVPQGPLVTPGAAQDLFANRGTGPARLNATERELAAYLDSIKDDVRGAVVFVGRRVHVPINLSGGPVRRLSDHQVRCRYDESAATDPACESVLNAPPIPRPPPDPTRLTAQEIDDRIDAFLVDHKAILRVNDAGRPHGQIPTSRNASYDPARMVSTVVMRNEDYGRVVRILDDGKPVEIEAKITNTFHPGGKTSYNAVAEIAGTDKAAEVVMAGAHLDSLTAATGAVDDAVGCAIVMEAARVLKALNLRPRRTIRIALFSGEEQGRLGSIAYVKAHFGTAEQPTPEFPKLTAYLDVDGGTGRFRGAAVFGPREAAAVLRDIFAPFKDLQIFGAYPMPDRTGAGGVDATTFVLAGLPAIAFRHDPIESGQTYHTNLDTYERVVEPEVRDAAIIVAATLFQLAMREEPLPRFSADKMPPPRRVGGQ